MISHLPVQQQQKQIRLFNAARDGVVNAVRKWVKRGADVNAANDKGFCSLMLAVHGGHMTVVRLLAELGADMNKISSINNATPVFVACLRGNAEMVQLVIELGGEPNVRTNEDVTPIQAAAQEGYADVVRTLVENGADINSPTDKGETPLYIAAQLNRLEVIHTLVELGADVNVLTNNLCTPVQAAAQSGHVDVIRALVLLGADVNMATNNGRTPVYSAAEQGQVAAIRVLFELGADVNTSTGVGTSPVSTAAEGGHLDVIRVLVVELGADVNAADHHGLTPVMQAAYKGLTKVIKLLYKLGADMNPHRLFSLTKVAQNDNHVDAVECIEKIMNKLTSECEFCGCSSKRLKLCGRCEKVRYCSSDCQKQDYKKHKKDCHAM